MMKNFHYRTTLICLAALLFGTCAAIAQPGDQDRERLRIQEQQQVHQDEPVYGSQMMTEEERNEFRERMRAAQTNEERDQIRAEHHERMQERAKERGVAMPENPPVSGMGQGMGPGGGMGQGRGMGPGSGMGGGGGRGR